MYFNKNYKNKMTQYLDLIFQIQYKKIYQKDVGHYKLGHKNHK